MQDSWRSFFTGPIWLRVFTLFGVSCCVRFCFLYLCRISLMIGMIWFTRWVSELAEGNFLLCDMSSLTNCSICTRVLERGFHFLLMGSSMSSHRIGALYGCVFIFHAVLARDVSRTESFYSPRTRLAPSRHSFQARRNCTPSVPAEADCFHQLCS